MRISDNVNCPYILVNETKRTQFTHTGFCWLTGLFTYLVSDKISFSWLHTHTHTQTHTHTHENTKRYTMANVQKCNAHPCEKVNNPQMLSGSRQLGSAHV